LSAAPAGHGNAKPLRQVVFYAIEIGYIPYFMELKNSLEFFNN
jgi:hypothetical protein